MEMNLLPPVLKKLTEEFPLLRPSIQRVPFPALFGLVENHQIQVALGTGDAKKKTSLYYRELYVAPTACICSPEHPLARHKSLTKKELSGNLIVCSPSQIADSVFAIQSGILVNLSPEQRFLTESIESAEMLAKHRSDICYIPIFRWSEIPVCAIFRSQTFRAYPLACTAGRTMIIRC